MHANAIANGVVVSFLSKMLTHRKITPAAIKPKLAMMKRLFNIFFISFSPQMNLVLAMSKAQGNLLLFLILPCAGHSDKRYKQQNTYKDRSAQLPVGHPHI